MKQSGESVIVFMYKVLLTGNMYNLYSFFTISLRLIRIISITSEELETYFLNLTGGADHAYYDKDGFIPDVPN